MKKAFAIVLSLFVFLTVGVTAFADIGPKDSVVIYINGVESGREYYIALLEEWEESPYNDKYIEDRDSVWKKIYEFSRADGFYPANSPVDDPYRKMTGDDSARWGYYPPQTFKVLLYFPDNESFLVSEVLHKYAFDSYFTVDVNGNSLTAAKGGGGKGIITEVVGLLIRVVLTVLIEIGIAFVFGYRGKRELKLILITNVITQVLLNALIAAADYSLGPLAATFAYIAGEIAVFIVEAAVYSANLPRITEQRTKGGRAVGYAFAANLASFVGGGALLLMADMLL